MPLCKSPRIGKQHRAGTLHGVGVAGVTRRGLVGWVQQRGLWVQTAGGGALLVAAVNAAPPGVKATVVAYLVVSVLVVVPYVAWRSRVIARK